MWCLGKGHFHSGMARVSIHSHLHRSESLFCLPSCLPSKKLSTFVVPWLGFKYSSVFLLVLTLGGLGRVSGCPLSMTVSRRQHNWEMPLKHNEIQITQWPQRVSFSHHLLTPPYYCQYRSPNSSIVSISTASVTRGQSWSENSKWEIPEMKPFLSFKSRSFGKWRGGIACHFPPSCLGSAWIISVFNISSCVC